MVPSNAYSAGSDDDLPGYVATPMPAELSSPTASETPVAANGDAEGAGDERAVSENEIYVSVGRRDGAKPSDFQTVLADAGIGPESTEYIRVRHRHAFVSVNGEKLEQALTALNGALIAGRKANAERARRD